MRTQLKKDEKLLIIIRKHWIKLILPMLAWLLLTIAILWWMPTGIGLIIILLAAIYPAVEYINWKYNLWAVTNMRVIDESGFFTRYSKESPLDKINNVSYDQTLWGRLFNYGHVEIQTAAEVGATDYYNVYHPKRLKDTITLAQAEYKNIQLGNQATQMAAAIGLHKPAASLIAAELEKLFELKQKGILSEEEYLKAKNKLIG